MALVTGYTIYASYILIASVLIAEHEERNNYLFSFSRVNMDFKYIKNCIPEKILK
jgi:hypothetical protein